MLTVFYSTGEKQLRTTAEQLGTLEKLKNIPSEAKFKSMVTY